MGRMSLLAPLVATDPASPRLTVYDETTGTRMEFSGVTLDNWANKIANMLVEEFDLAPGDAATLLVDLPLSWQATVIPIGIHAACLTPTITTSAANAVGLAGTGHDRLACPAGTRTIVFTTAEHSEHYVTAGFSDVIAVSDDPFGRGVVESGGALPTGVVDFGPTVRFYGDQYFGDSPDLRSWLNGNRAGSGERILIPGWSDRVEFDSQVMAPLAAGGSVVLVTGMASTERIAQIIEAEKVQRS